MTTDDPDSTHRRAERWMIVQTRGGALKEKDLTRDIIDVGAAIGAARIIVEAARDDDGLEEYLETHWARPGDPD